MTALQIVFWLSTVLLLYVFAGYPLWVMAMARWRPRPIRREAMTPSVTVVFAVHDGAAQLPARLANLASLDYPPELLEIVVACDGCTDDSAARCRQWGDSRVRVLEFPQRRGKAACLNDAVAIARGDILLMIDVRQRLAPDALRQLVANLADPSIGVAGGALCFEDPATGFACSVDAYWRYETLIRRCESLSDSTVGVSGALYAIRRALFQPLPDGTVLDDVLVPMRAARTGARVIFEPRAQAWDCPSDQPAQEQRRKIRTLSGNYQLLQLAPWLLSPRQNRLWFRFVSHKLLRLLAPWLLLAQACSSAALARDHLLCAVAFAGLLLAATLVLLARLWPGAGRWLPVRVSVGFFYLNLYAGWALVTFLRQRRLHLW
ncbi:glycosyltransferase family 2 protein [Dyella sp.]|jgi:cellulose synthase/poly-beta-1,6-N-acetylglucosamine synthase-like glycosyltransferase|uniref:glycosyltransferase family 2 protein n=1 Tax=Dyella sp. TaxID=1869338 RepID=UPI002D799249|nr:glycosyltransferase family 2 protein [Dyella sp.]HET6432956.1 glycosyltransferase family 2 protein [Dyella sp.]